MTPVPQKPCKATFGISDFCKQSHWWSLDPKKQILLLSWIPMCLQNCHSKLANNILLTCPALGEFLWQQGKNTAFSQQWFIFSAALLLLPRPEPAATATGNACRDCSAQHSYPGKLQAKPALIFSYHCWTEPPSNFKAKQLLSSVSLALD